MSWGKNRRGLSRVRNVFARLSKPGVRGFAIAAAATLIVAMLGVGYIAVKRLLPPADNASVLAAAESVTELDGADPAIVLTPHDEARGIVIYAHGNNQDERTIINGSNVAPVVARLLGDGYLVAASHAAGNAWGNAASVSAYEELVTYTRTLTDATDLFLMGESMGGLPTFELASRLDDVKAVVGFYPVCDARTLADQDDLQTGITAAYPDGADAISPAAMPSVPMMFWASPDDTRVPKAKNADACAESAREGGAEVTVISTTGNHGDPSNFDADAIIEFFEAHASA